MNIIRKIFSNEQLFAIINGIILYEMDDIPRNKLAQPSRNRNNRLMGVCPFVCICSYVIGINLQIKKNAPI